MKKVVYDIKDVQKLSNTKSKIKAVKNTAVKRRIGLSTLFRTFF